MSGAPTPEPSRQGFAPYLGRPFRLKNGGVVLRLDRIETAPPPPFGHREPFSLIFRSDLPGPVLPEDFYVFTLEGDAECALYVMPIHTPEPDRQEYQAAFN